MESHQEMEINIVMGPLGTTPDNLRSDRQNGGFHFTQLTTHPEVRLKRTAPADTSSMKLRPHRAGLVVPES
jgi:hypothetical protein